MQIRPAAGTGLVLAAATALLLVASGSAAAGPAAGHPAGTRADAVGSPGHRRLCAGSCRANVPVTPVRPPRGDRARSARPGTVSPQAGSWGFDMNGTGCSGTSFAAGAEPQGITNAPHLGFDSIQLNGWGWANLSDNDPCYQAQARWYAHNDPGKPVQLIMFPVPYDNNYCSSYSTSPGDGHNAGRNQAARIYRQARDGGLKVTRGMWWLDIEATQCNGWDPSKYLINLAVIQGAVDYLHSQGARVGIYTDSYDWNQITNYNTTQFGGIPAWNAVPYGPPGPYVKIHNDSRQNPYDWPHSVLPWAQQECTHAGFTGGPLQAVQYMWGNFSAPEYTTDQPPAIIGRDFDFECRGPRAPRWTVSPGQLH
jgi:hypothetical protein